MLAHGGTAGLIVEIATVLAIVVLGLVVWVASRNGHDEDET